MPAGRQTGQEVPALLPSKNRVEFDRLSLEQGLSQGTVMAMAQDGRGFIWISTEDALNRYDGHTFKEYRHDPADPYSPATSYNLEFLTDQEGQLWIRKSQGRLDRYDWKTDRFYHYDLVIQDEDSATDFVWTIYQDKGGTVWAGTYRSGLHRYDPETDSFVAYQHDPGDDTSLSNNRVYAIYEDRAGDLWIGTMDGLNRLDRETGRFVRYLHDPDDPGSVGADIVQQIFEDSAGRLWLTTYGVGLEQLDPKTGRIVARYQHDPADPHGIDRVDAITGLYEDREGHLWINHFDGRLDKFDPEEGTFLRYRHDPDDPQSISADTTHFIAEDKDSNLWVGTLEGLDQYDYETGGFVHYRHNPHDAKSISGSSVISFFQDRGGVLWFGTDGRGINVYAPHRRKFDHYRLDPEAEDGVLNNFVQAIHQDGEGMVWVATNAGLNRLDPISGQVTRFVHHPDDPGSLSRGIAQSLYEDETGRLWVGTQSGLDRFDPQTETFRHYEQVDAGSYALEIGEVVSIHGGEAGTLWLGKYRAGLCKFLIATGECNPYIPDANDTLNPQNMILHVYRDKDDRFWLATEGGLLEFDPRSETFVVYQHVADNPLSLSSNAVRAIYEDNTGRLWVGTAGGGLDLFDPDAGGFQHYTEADGLPDDSVVGILQDRQGFLWLSTKNGLSRFDPELGEFRNFDTSDGLQSKEFLVGAAYQNAEGELFLGGTNGLNVFRPEQIRDNPFLPPIVLTSLTQGGEPIATDRPLHALGQVTLRWPNNYFEFEFAALDYTQPEKNKYAYVLEAFDESWNNIGPRHFGRYTNLPGGDYTLRLMGSNNDGIWNYVGAAVRITVVPPVWDTWWFRGSIVLLLIGGVFVAYRRRVRQVEAKSRDLEMMVEERTQALAERTRELLARTREIEDHKQKLEALYRADAELHRHLGLDQVIQALVDIAVEIIQADKSCLLLWDAERERLKLTLTRGYQAEASAEQAIVSMEGMAGQAAISGQPVFVEDTTTDPRTAGQTSLIRTEDIRSSAQVPILVGGHLFGVFSADYTRFRAFGPEDRRLFLSLAQRAALAIENAQLYEQTQEVAAVRERSRLARDLHDAVTQTLFSASLIAEALPELWEDNPDEGRQMLQELRKMNRGAMAEMRTLLMELRPAVLVEANLGDLLRQLGEAVTGRTGVPVVVDINGNYPLPPDVHVALYRIAQEALNNVIKHAKASQVVVRLQCRAGSNGQGRSAEMEVNDDGLGFDPARVPQDRLGLGIIYERAEAIGARLQIESQPNEGTQIVLVWEEEK
jgi:signal transduction histidine kinase/ligand-binding sensor domain-containing protein